ncbi:MAG: YidH family protein [Mucilaginibacter sp.]
MKENSSKGSASDYLANERTLLAWVRTGVGVMAFGFVVVKFSLFVRQLSLALGNKVQIPQYGYSGPIGIILVAAGALSLLLSLARYHQTTKQLNEGYYKHSSVLLYGMVAFVFIAGVLLMAYLLKTA